MKLKPEGIWKSSDGSIMIAITSIPKEDDYYSIEYSQKEKITHGKIHLSNTNDKLWHISEENVCSSHCPPLNPKLQKSLTVRLT